MLTDDVLAELKDLETKLWVPEYRFNLKWMENILAEDFFEYGRSGRIYSRSECLQIEERPIQVTLPLIDFKIRALANNMLQVTYRSEVQSDEGLELGLRSSLWIKTADKWQLVFHQGTAI